MGGTADTTEEYTYNDKNQLIEVKIPQNGVAIDGVTVNYEIHSFSYDSEGRLIKEAVFYDIDSVTDALIMQHEYNSEGRIIETKIQAFYDGKWNLLGRSESHYSDSNKKEKIDYYEVINDIEDFTGYSILEYDSKGMLLKQQSYDEDDTLLNEMIFEYEEYSYSQDDNMPIIDEIVFHGLTNQGYPFWF